MTPTDELPAPSALDRFQPARRHGRGAAPLRRVVGTVDVCVPSVQPEQAVLLEKMALLECFHLAAPEPASNPRRRCRACLMLAGTLPWQRAGTVVDVDGEGTATVRLGGDTTPCTCEPNPFECGMACGCIGCHRRPLDQLREPGGETTGREGLHHAADGRPLHRLSECRPGVCWTDEPGPRPASGVGWGPSAEWVSASDFVRMHGRSGAELGRLLEWRGTPVEIVHHAGTTVTVRCPGSEVRFVPAVAKYDPTTNSGLR